MKQLFVNEDHSWALDSYKLVSANCGNCAWRRHQDWRRKKRRLGYTRRFDATYSVGNYKINVVYKTVCACIYVHVAYGCIYRIVKVQSARERRQGSLMLCFCWSIVKKKKKPKTGRESVYFCKPKMYFYNKNYISALVSVRQVTFHIRMRFATRALIKVPAHFARIVHTVELITTKCDMRTIKPFEQNSYDDVKKM